MTILLFTTAIALSVVAAWYAISGLVAIFAASVIPIMIMGSLLEASKLVVASWLYRSWAEIPRLMKAYFTVALVVLMLLTSMGIFGFLSKAHLDQAVPTGDVAAKVQIIDEKIAIEQQVIAQYRKDLEVLNEQIDRYNELGAVTRGVKAREAQREERDVIFNKIEEGQTNITKLREERAPLQAEMRKVEAEVGPQKYIAALIYGDQLDQTLLESAVRIVIMLIVFVFDPLAVLMLIAANWSLKNAKKEFREVPSVPPATETFEEPTITEETPTETPATQQEITINDTVEVKENPTIDDIKLEDESKDWEPELYEKNKRKLGRFLSELDEIKPNKTKSFLDKVGGLSEKGVGINSIEHVVDDLQVEPPFKLDDNKN